MSLKDDYVADMNARLKLQENKTEGTFGQDIIGAVGYEFSAVQETQIDTLLNRAFATTATGDDLDLCGADVGLDRKQATYATVPVRVEGYPNQMVGTDVKITFSNLVFTCTENKNIPEEGFVDVTFKCDSPGVDGNVDEGTVFDFVGSYYGLTSAVATGDGAGGTDKESDDDYRERILFKIRSEASSGNKAHYQLWAESVDGVGKAIILPLWNGNGTVKVLISTPDKTDPTEELLQRVSDYIEDNAPIGATVTVASVDYVDIDITADCVIDESGSTTTVKAEFSEYLKNYLDTADLTVSYLRMSDLLFNCKGVEDITNYTMNGGKVSINLAQTEVARVGNIIINEA